MRRLFLLTMSLFLGVASVAAVVAIYSLNPSAVSRATSGSGEVEVARRYYEAVNHMIATGDPAPLQEVLGNDMIEIDSPGAGFGGREGIEQYLGFLHAAAPDTLIEPASIADDRGQLFVHLSVVREPATTMLGIALD